MGRVECPLEQRRTGVAENWLRHLEDVSRKHADRLDDDTATEVRASRLCELNVIEQVVNVCQTTVVEDAWQRGQALSVHGWVYGLKDGRLRDLGFSASGAEELLPAYQRACDGALAAYAGDET